MARTAADDGARAWAAVAAVVDRAAVQEVLGGPAEAVRTSRLWPRGVDGGPEETDPAADPAATEESLAAFAERVMKTARGMKTGRYGDDRVFISHVWRALGDSSLDERAFKQRLLEANQKRHLSLSRADMVELMDPKDVSTSETRYLGSTFHFIAL